MKTFQVSTYFFAFESDFVNTLKCVPMIVRYKLDGCRVKLQLSEWTKFNQEDKRLLACLPCYTPTEIEYYGMFVKRLIKRYTGHEAGMLTALNDSWNNINEIPEEVILKAAEWKCTALTLNHWMRLGTLQRFALVKLSRSGHEGRNFPVALKEFGIV